ncbi:hypothetical protein M422DRAFT_275674 [Sphaerobolus stellatus SS14]|uniref:Uncharacterized protein n=1 Tax=Sphaerobolus stellatus (strain SS14) TaxID=990650 RepID=A0A0C9UEM2_SPHS4|nr:hypothetical protein M422DRAFT_275674 [Sphaerobolus stellatus SS14]
MPQYMQEELVPLSFRQVGRRAPPGVGQDVINRANTQDEIQEPNYWSHIFEESEPENPNILPVNHSDIDESEFDSDDSDEFFVCKCDRTIVDNRPKVRIGMYNPIRFRQHLMAGVAALRSQCFQDWLQLPVCHQGFICPSMIQVTHVRATRWSKGVAEPDIASEAIRVKFLKSSLDRLGQYIDTGKSGPRFKRFKKVGLRQQSLDGSFDVEFSFYWKTPPVEQREPDEDYRDCLIILRHNLLAPDVFARLSTVHIELVRRHVIDNPGDFWG